MLQTHARTRTHTHAHTHTHTQYIRWFLYCITILSIYDKKIIKYFKIYYDIW